MRDERLAGRTAQRAIRLWDKVTTREAALFPGLACYCRAIALPGGSVGGLFLPWGESGSKLGGPYRLRLELMAQPVAEPLRLDH